MNLKRKQLSAFSDEFPQMDTRWWNQLTAGAEKVTAGLTPSTLQTTLLQQKRC